MKKILLRTVVLLLVLLSVLLASACGNTVTVYELTGDAVWYEYPVSNAPVHTVCAGDTWYSLIGLYGSSDFSLSVSDNYAATKEVYSVCGVGIWFFDADENGAVWCEMSAEGRSFKYYNKSTGEVKEIFYADIPRGFQNANVGMYNGGIYFAHIDYENKSAFLMRYDIAKDTVEKFHRLEYIGETSCTSFTVSGNVLLASVGSQNDTKLIKLDLDNGSYCETWDISSNVAFVYACAYDPMGVSHAIYYRDSKGNEHIGALDAKTLKLKSIFTFGENIYAYQDRVEAYGGHIYWINQANVSGVVSDHYRFIDYNAKDDIVDEYVRTFGFSVVDDGIMLLSFNRMDYDGIYLSCIYLGGEKE